MSQIDSEEVLEVSDLETQFVPRDDDDEVLWEVIEIIDENQQNYKVRWKGKNPKTGKSWAPSWVEKHDCTNDLVWAWKEKKARRRLSASTMNSPASAVSRKSGKRSESVKSPSVSIKSNRRIKDSTTPKHNPVWDDPPTAGPSTITKKRKKSAQSSSDAPESKLVESSSRPSKRQKKSKSLSGASNTPARSRSGSRLRQQVEVEIPLGRDQDTSTAGPYRLQGGMEDSSDSDSSQVVTARRKGKGKEKAQVSVPKKTGPVSRTKVVAKKTTKATPLSVPDSEPGEEEDEEEEPVNRKGSKSTRKKSANHDNGDDTVHQLSPISLHDSDADGDTEGPDRDSVGDQRSKNLAKHSTANDEENQHTFTSFGEPHLLAETIVHSPEPHVEPEDAAPHPPASSNTKHRNRSSSHDPTERSKIAVDEGTSSIPPAASIPREQQFIPLARLRREAKAPRPTARKTSEAYDVSPSLSPDAKARLLEFDEFCREIDEEEKRADAEPEREREQEQEQERVPSKPASPIVVADYIARRGTSETGYDTIPPVETPAETPAESLQYPEQDPVEEPSSQPEPKDQAAEEIVPETTRPSVDRQLSTSRSSPERTTLVSKMKPRSPSKANLGSRSSSLGRSNGDVTVTKPLKPVPVVSPSRFTPYLRQSDDDVEEAIEQYPSPEKKRPSPMRDQESENEEEREKEVRQRALAMHDKWRQQERAAVNGRAGEVKKRSLSAIMKVADYVDKEPDQGQQTVDVQMVDDHLIPQTPANMSMELEYPVNYQEQEPDRSPETSVPLKTVSRVEKASQSEPIPDVLQEKLEEISKLQATLARERSEREVLMKEQSDNSVEISKLQRVAAEERAEKETLLQKIQALEQALAAASIAKPEPTPVSSQVQEDLEKKLADALKKAQDAEKDRDFFREEWSKASGFVTSVRAESIELEKRAEIAEGRARDGVAMVRATFEERVKFLEEDARKWQQIAKFIMEKDSRTNDEVRRRAAEEPELRRNIDRLEGELEELNLQLESLEDHKASLEEQVDSWKRETVRLNTELNEVKAQSVGEELGVTTQICRCQYRDENNRQCLKYFSSMELLENHLMYSSHVTERTSLEV